MTLAYRQKRRRDSIKSAETPAVQLTEQSNGQDYFNTAAKTASHSRKRSLSLEEFREQMGASANMLSPMAVPEKAMTR